MARTKVVVLDMMKVKRNAPKVPFLGWGYTQTRKTSTVAESPRLLAYRSCIGGGMAGKTFEDMKGVQSAFQALTGTCKVEAEKKPTILKS